MELTKEMIASAKQRGFLRNRDSDRFSARVVVPGGLYTPDQLDTIARCANVCGNGTVAFTVRQSAEIVGIPYEKIDQAIDLIESSAWGLIVGGTGPRVRPIVACKGTTCVFGRCDTQAIAAELHRRYYIGMRAQTLPHKFKIAVGGCPNSCVKPSLNDFGLEGTKRDGITLYKVFVGGTWGKTTRVGNPLSRLLSLDEVYAALEGVIGWYSEKAKGHERLGAVIDRLGLSHLEAHLGLI